MLQQTTVATVTPRFFQFLEQFPTIAALAEADEQAVLKQWEGLGYYSRARNLHRAARILFERFGEQIPDDPEFWAELPGVGPYILGAVLSQAFDRRLPIVEANTRRVLARLGANPTELGNAGMQRWLWERAAEILPKKQVGDFNQAMMELGSQICTPRDPDCPNCPLKKSCGAFRQGIQSEIPNVQKKTAPSEISEACVVIRHRDCFYLRQRPPAGRWAGMWEFPTREFTPPADAGGTAAELLLELGCPGKPGASLVTIPYTVMRFRVRMTCVEVILGTKASPVPYDKVGRWVTVAELSEYPIRSSQRKLANLLARPIQREMF